MWNPENGGYIEQNKPVKEGISNYKKNSTHEAINETKKQIEILTFLDELKIPENKQRELMKKILKYDIFDEVKKVFDENDINNIIEKKEIENKKIEKNNTINSTNEFIFLNNSENKKTISENEKTKNNEKEFEKYKSLIDFLRDKSGLDLNNPIYGEILKSLIEKGGKENLEITKIKDELEKLKITKIKDELEKLKDPLLFNSLAKDLGGTGSEKYESFKSSLITIDPSFEKSFQSFENKEISTKLNLGTSDLSGVKFTKTGSIQDIDNDLQVKVEDGKRSISTTGEIPYSLKSELDNEESKDEIDDINSELKRSIDNINRKINIMEFLIKNVETNDKLKEVKENMRFYDASLYMDLNMESITDITQLKSVIYTKKEELEKQKTNLKKQAKEKIDYIIIEQELAAEQKDKIKKDILKFLHETGFDKFSQLEINKIIDNLINKNPSKYGLQEKIDFEKGSLGFDFDSGNHENLSSKEKEEFIKLFNKMLSGKPDNPIKQANGEVIGDSHLKEIQFFLFNNSNKLQSTIGNNLNKTETM